MIGWGGQHAVRGAAADTLLQHRPFGGLSPEQSARLAAFREQHPDIRVHCVEGVWRAENGEGVAAGPAFEDLMRKIEERYPDSG